MGVPQSLAAVLALLALVLAVEGVTRGSTKQLFAGLLLAIVATLTFSFGDTLSTFNIQMVEQLPRWSDVPHPLPEPAPPPAPAKTEAAPPKIQTTTSNDTSANLDQEASTKQVTASPRFYAVYPREVFMSEVDWKNPAVPALAPLYDALEKGDWKGAFKLCNDGLDQTYSLPWVTGRYYRGHIIWLMTVAQLEYGDQMQASDLLSTARKMITYSTTDNSDQDRMMIDVALFSDFANVPSPNLPHQVDGIKSQDQAMIHYAKALYYQGTLL